MLAVETPAFVIDLRTIAETIDRYDRLRAETGVRVLYATKPLLHRDVLKLFAARLDGLTASSLFSAELCREALGTRATLSMVTPAYRDAEIDRIAALCDQVILNSLGQWERFAHRLCGKTSVGLRVNPGLSFLPDARYDPGRAGGKLGIPLDDLARTPLSDLRGVEGVHFHTNSESPNYEPLLEIVRHLLDPLEGLFRQAEWINLGGGYHLPHPDEWRPLGQTVELLQKRYPRAVVYIEPGASLVRSSGSLVSSVVDLFSAEGRHIAILDTTVNHLPEVFEYQYAPEVTGHSPDNPFVYTLAGATCLAGDTFGTYHFAEPLSIGTEIVFPNVGAYTFAKAHWFNGIALPTLYTIDLGGRCHLRRRFGPQDYRNQIGWEEETG